MSQYVYYVKLYRGGVIRMTLSLFVKVFYLTIYCANYMLDRFSGISFSHIEYLPLQWQSYYTMH